LFEPNFYDKELRRHMTKATHSLIDHVRQNVEARTEYQAQAILKSILEQYDRRGTITDKQKMCLCKFIFYIQHIQPVPPMTPSPPPPPPPPPQSNQTMVSYSPFGNPMFGQYQVKAGVELVTAYIEKQQKHQRQKRAHRLEKAIRTGVSIHRVQID
jgi:hypothetical protein